MATPDFEANHQKTETQAMWDSYAVGWLRWTSALAQFLNPATEKMLDMAGLQTGYRVLDVAAGAGGQTILAARRVGADGLVLATDLSSQILAFASDELHKANLINVEVRVMDGECLDLVENSFDAVICRMGVMLFPDPLRSLIGMRRVVKPGKKVAVMVFSVPEQCGFLAIPAAILMRRAKMQLPSPGAPGLFSLGYPGKLQTMYEQAGFQDVQIHSVSASQRMPSVAESVRLIQDTVGIFQGMLARLSEADRQAAWQEVEQALWRYEVPGGFEAPCELLLAVGTK